ncbi:DUF885 family protein [Pseudodesulfovibrio sediminis]|uniref:DUF885 domain-containing protein n=1 Tax=Pseudodesulfovibrio sediminis TaxID=2810563 RepID=A0ABN6ETC8_9BACT|nr:DUF885 family protein [Pseudodesulfovibrio sediminis]BCS88424.1 hypothetical protein PSDVSF_16660 [Pseudodesulfovibrio sediminis]
MSLKIAKKYFAYVAKQFPVMCASGAFPMLPPVTDSSKWMDRLDDLSQKGIAKHVATLTQYKESFLNSAAKAASPEAEAQAQALALSAGGAIAELDQIRAWEKMPELYLSVAFTGLEQAADLPAKNDKVLQKRFMKRLREIPGLLEQGTNNVEAISSSSRATSQTMIRDCARYLTNLGNSDLGQVGKTPRFLADALAALKEYDRFVTTRPEVMDNQGPSFAYLAEHVYGTDKSPEQILAIAEEEWDCRLASLAWFESEIGQGKGWRELYDEYAGPVIDDMEALDVVIREIHRLRNFVLETALPGVFTNTGLRIEPQPLHMASTLRPIHHDPALGAWENEPSRCYASPQIFSGRGFRDNPMQLARARKEFPFSVASQTYPGRHLLDSQRRSLGDSPLSQVTNPLFMAGWLAFAENLLEELGYLEFPLDRLVHHKRGLARAGLAMVDAGLATETMDQQRCMSILKTAGYSTTEALNHILSIRLAPAERAMPILGLHEITSLRKASRMDLGPFCTALFAGGQLPFHQIRRHMGF